MDFSNIKHGYGRGRLDNYKEILLNEDRSMWQVCVNRLQKCNKRMKLRSANLRCGPACKTNARNRLGLCTSNECKRLRKANSKFLDKNKDA